MANAVSVPPTYILERGQQVKVFSLIARKARQLGFVIPDDKALTHEGKYDGATVLDARRGAYFDPVATLDFASLYPSIIRAHNLCYSTIVLDASQRPDEVYEISTGVGTYAFAQGVPAVLPALLTELAEFRKRSKRDMAEAKARGDDWAAKVHNGKQLAYKVSMNSVYGFTGASKGFLPCVPVAAAVTATGRNMIQHTKRLAEELQPGTTVIYGDTDSVMVLFPPSVAATLPEVFRCAEKLAADISATFQRPIELEFEKVYWPQLLFAKKRYAGKFLVWGYEGVRHVRDRDPGRVAGGGGPGRGHRVQAVPLGGVACLARLVRGHRAGRRRAGGARVRGQRVLRAGDVGRGVGAGGPDRRLRVLPFLRVSSAGLMYTSPDKPDYIDTKGIQLVRRDNCPLVKDVSVAILEEIMRRKDPDAALAAAREHVARVLRGEHDMAAFVVSKALRGDYKNDAQPHVYVARKVAARRGYPVPHGERVPYVFVEGNDKCKLQAERAEDPAFARENGLHLDLKYYLEHQLLSPMVSLFELMVPNPAVAILEHPDVKPLLRAAETARTSRANKRQKQREITDFLIKM